MNFSYLCRRINFEESINHYSGVLSTTGILSVTTENNKILKLKNIK